MAYLFDDALAHIVFTFGEHNDDFFFYSTNQDIHSQLWPTTRNKGIQPLYWPSITRFYSVAFSPGLDVFVAYRDSRGVDRHHFRLLGTKPYERRKGKSDADYQQADIGLRRLDQWITAAISTQHSPSGIRQSRTTAANYSSLRLVFGPKRDKLYGNPQPNPWGGCYFARSTAPGGSTIWNDLPHLCQESLDARRRRTGRNGDPLLMAFGLNGSYVTLWHDSSHDRHIGAEYPSLENFLLQNQGVSCLVDVVLAPKSPDTFYARLYNRNLDVYVSFLRGPIARADLLQLNEALKAPNSEYVARDGQEWKRQVMTVIVTDCPRSQGSRAIQLPEYGNLNLDDVRFVPQTESRLDEGLKAGVEVFKTGVEIGSAASSCLLM